MNALQKRTALVAAVLILLSGLFPRYVGVYNAATHPREFDMGHSFILYPPSSSEVISRFFKPDAPSGLDFNASTRINLPDFAVKITTVATAAFALVVAFKDR